MIFGVTIWGIILMVVAIVRGLRKPEESESEGIARLDKAVMNTLDKAMMNTKDDPIEPARFAA